MSWTVEDVYEGSPEAEYIGFDENGEAHVVWSDSAPALMHTWRHDGVWTEPETIHDSDATYSKMGFAVRGDKLCAAWQVTDSGVVTLRVATADVGGSWSVSDAYTWTRDSIEYPPTHIMTYQNWTGVGCSVGLDSTGSPHVVTGVRDISIVRGMNDPEWIVQYFTGSWTPSTIYSSGLYGEFLPDVSVSIGGFAPGQSRAIWVDDSNGVHVVFTVMNFDEAWNGIGYWNGSGVAWTYYNSGPDTDSLSLAVTADEAGVPAITYWIDPGDGSHYYYDDGAWGAPHEFETSTIGYSSAITSHAGKRAIAWYDGSDLVYSVKSASWQVESVIDHEASYMDMALRPVSFEPWILFYDWDTGMIRVAWPGAPLAYVTMF